MSYCINPACSQPKNPIAVNQCQTCGEDLRLRDRYRIIKALGRGGFGATFLAKDESLPGHPACVIKQLRPAAESPHVLQMARDLFQREAKTLGKIGNHPQLPRLLDYFENNQEFFLVQEYISGATLQQEVRRGGPFSEAGVRQFLSEILPMIQYVHSHQVIHRDIKPANLIRREQDRKLVLIDFGAVKDKVDPTRANSTEQTALTAYAIGTPGYAPPEQMAMRPVYASDLYAIGVTCTYLLTGKSPKDFDYDPRTGEILWRKQVQVSEHFANVLEKMLDISVRHRYQSAEAILRELDLEPYLDSLAQNMAFQSGNPSNSGPLTSPSDNLGEPTSPSSPSSRMAAAIRARKERSSAKSAYTIVGGPGRGLQARSSGSQSGLVLSPSQVGNQSAKLVKLTAEDLKTSYIKGKRDFSMQKLDFLDLRRTKLVGANFTQSKLQKTNFQGSDLSSANFGRANLAGSTLRNTILGRAYFNYANLQGADLRGANLNHACLTNANLRGANLSGADLTGAKISSEQLAMARTNWSTVYPNGKRGLRQ
ncbi:MAG: serine/threonine-protein kinase [Pseudanabaenales cyanobacterium]|nr:serine/threonine-protein kinase [Pseudanabaenales cyanobacterium]